MTYFFHQIGEQQNKYLNPFLKSQQNKNGQSLYATEPQKSNNVKPEGFLNVLQALDRAVPKESLKSNNKAINEDKPLSESEEKRLVQKLEGNISRYKSDAIQGNTRAISKLESLRNGVDEDMQKLSSNKSIEVADKAGRAFKNIMDNIQSSPKLLNALMKMSNEDPKRPGNSQESKMASFQLSKMMNEGKIDIDRDVKPLLKQNPKTVMKALDGLCKSNIPRKTRQKIAALMSEFAKTHATSEAGDIATNNLHNLVRQEGQNGVLDQAFEGLKGSALNGNHSAVFSLEKIANENLSSKNKASKAVNALATIAKEKPNDAVGSLAVKSLRKTASKQAGNSTGLLAKNAINQVANSGNDPMQAKRKPIFAQNNMQNSQFDYQKSPFQNIVA